MNDTEARAVRKITRRLLLILIPCFVLCFLDRVNVGYATLTMSKELGFSGTVFGLGAGLFFVGYFLFEVPSNMALERFGARIWLFRVMATWGILSGATAFVWNDWSFYTIRFLLGLAEAGFFPGVAFYFTLWLPSRHRGRVNAMFLAAMPFSAVLGGPISGYLLTLDGLFGLHGWQLLYLVEGLPSFLIAFLLLVYLRDVPANAEWLVKELRYEHEHTTVLVKHGLANILKSPIILLLCVIYFGIAGINFGLNFFVPQIVHNFGVGLFLTGCISAVPFFIGGVGMIVWGGHSDKHNERRFHVLSAMCLAVAGLGGATLIGDPVVKLILLCIASFGVFSCIPVFWTLMPTMLSPAAVAVALAVVNSVGNLAGFSAPFVVGLLKDMTGTVNTGLQVVVLLGLIAIVLLSLLLHHQSSMAKKLNMVVSR